MAFMTLCLRHTAVGQVRGKCEGRPHPPCWPGEHLMMASQPAIVCVACRSMTHVHMHALGLSPCIAPPRGQAALQPQLPPESRRALRSCSFVLPLDYPLPPDRQADAEASRPQVPGSGLLLHPLALQLPSPQAPCGQHSQLLAPAQCCLHRCQCCPCPLLAAHDDSPHPALYSERVSCSQHADGVAATMHSPPMSPPLPELR